MAVATRQKIEQLAKARGLVMTKLDTQQLLGLVAEIESFNSREESQGTQLDAHGPNKRPQNSRTGSNTDQRSRGRRNSMGRRSMVRPPRPIRFRQSQLLAPTNHAHANEHQ
jgi:hypothetical protein